MSGQSCMRTLVETFGEKLICPFCGWEWVHPIGVSCNPSGKHGGYLFINSGGVKQVPNFPRQGRGVHIELIFYCERGHKFKYELSFHKGNTNLKRESLPAPTQWEETIWRD